MASHFDDNLKRAFALKNTREAEDLYDEWAADYDKEVAGIAYASPKRAVDALVQNVPAGTSELRIIDAGCGTGLVGVDVAKAYKGRRPFVIDGLDLSPGMLAAARNKNVYRDLEPADLTKPIKRQDGVYDAVTCVGTLTQGHVGPKVLLEFARVLKSEGLIVATIHDEVWTSVGFSDEIERLSKEGILRVVSNQNFGITEDANSGGKMVVLQKL